MALPQDKMIEFNIMIQDASYMQLQLMQELIMNEMKITVDAIRQGTEGWEK